MYSGKAYSTAALQRPSSVTVPCSQVKSAVTLNLGVAWTFNTISNRSASNDAFLSPSSALEVVCSNSKLEYPFSFILSVIWENARLEVKIPARSKTVSLNLN